MQVLVVDNDGDTLDALERALARAGLETVPALDLASAVELFTRSRPAAVILRVDLPGEDARAICSALRRAPEGETVPVLFFGSAAVDDPVRSPSEALAAGGDYFFRRPLDHEQVAKRVLQWITPPPSPEPARPASRAGGSLEKALSSLAQNADLVEPIAQLLPTIATVEQMRAAFEALASRAPERAWAIALAHVAFHLAQTSEANTPTVELAPAALSIGGDPPDRTTLETSPLPPEALPESLSRLDPEARLVALANIVRTSDYFTILGLTFEAETEAVIAAHGALRRLVRIEDFQRSPDLFFLARDVLRTLDEARDVLAVPALRAAYRRHLRPATP
jgi:CheY-like chemotaxis protein